MATRYCFIDYDREIAIVAEIEEEGPRNWSAWGDWSPTPTMSRGIRDLVGDRWQNQGSAAC